MPWYDNAYNEAPPQRSKLQACLDYLKAAVDGLGGATAPVGTIAWLGSSGAGSAYVLDGPYAKQADGTWLWRPDLHGGLIREDSVAVGSIGWTIADGLSRVINKVNWEFGLTGSGSATIVLGTRYSNTRTIDSRLHRERVYFGFEITSGLTVTFSADTGITLRRATGSSVASFAQAGPAFVRFVHGDGVWQEL